MRVFKRSPIARRREEIGVLQRNLGRATTPLGRMPRARVIHQDDSHQVCRDAVELAPALEVLLLVDQPQVGFVDQLGRLKVPALAPL